MDEFRTKLQVRNYLKGQGYKTHRGVTKTGKYIYEDYDGKRVVVDWEKRTVEDVYPVDGAWFHLHNM